MKNKTIKLTKEQQDATQIGFNVSLSANAGAGKTAVLVERYINLLKNGVNVNEIVAITFTKKAANEMIERISDKLDNLIQNENSPTNKKRQYKDMRKQLVTANISTIHSFCLTILKDYIIEAGLDANFKEASSFKRYNIITEAIDSALEQIIMADEANELLFTYYTRNEIVNILKKIIDKPDLVRTLEGINSCSFEEWNEKIMLSFYKQTISDVRSFIEYLDIAYYSFDKVNFKSDNQALARSIIERILEYKSDINITTPSVANATAIPPREGNLLDDLKFPSCGGVASRSEVGVVNIDCYADKFARSDRKKMPKQVRHDRKIYITIIITFSFFYKNLLVRLWKNRGL